MNGSAASVADARRIAEGLTGSHGRVAVCPPLVLAHRIGEAVAGSGLLVGAQDVHWATSGAHTGDHGPDMLREAGLSLVLVGHSERRQAYGDSDETVGRKAVAARQAGLEPVICVGETSDQREAGVAEAAVAAQLAESAPADLGGQGFAVAYEPVWAIGSGRSPPTEVIARMHAAIRESLARRFGRPAASIPILYGGSVTPETAAPILRTPGVDGVLVGGASLRPAEFLAIVDQIPSA